MSRSRDSQSRGFDMEGLIGYILLAGVVLSIVLIVSGLVWNYLATGAVGAEYVIKGANLLGFVTHTAGRISAVSLDAHAMINLGIIVLLLTPYTRVVASVFYFAIAERNWKYVCFTTVVLAVLTYSLFLG